MYIERNLTAMNREQELLNKIGVAWGKAVRKSTIMVRESFYEKGVLCWFTSNPSSIQACKTLK